MGARIRGFDWSATRLGPIEGWPDTLRSTLRVALGSRYPMFLWWGEDLTNLYNDAYISVLGARHPDALGRSAREVWHEIWDTVGPQAEQVLREGRATFNEELLLVMERYGYREETYFTFSYSPVPGADGVGGVFCACFEDTRRVVGERRMRLLRELAEATQSAKDADEACESAAGALARHDKDIPFALLYLREDGGRVARLAGAAGIEPGEPVSPGLIALGDKEPWPLSEPVDASPFPFGARLGVESFAGPWADPVREALVLPIPEVARPEPAGWLVLGVSPLRPFDAEYRSFAQLVCAAVASGLARARAYQDERRRAEALAELDRAKTIFFSNVSHEFRTPLTLMLGPLEDALAEADERLGERSRERLQLAHRSTQRLLKLVNTLLDFVRIESGRFEALYQPVDLAALTQDLASTFRSAIERAGLSLEVACEPLPEPVFVDRQMWEKIVFNLLSNAFKFTLAGSIRVSVEARGEHAVLSVSDTGIGIPANDLPHLFERFRRVKGARGRSEEGTGIGLALVHELVQLHGGRVDVESRLGEGSTFAVAIPTGCAHLPRERVGKEAAPALPALGARPFVEEALRWLPDAVAWPGPALEHEAVPLGAATRGATVLVADDNADLRAYLRSLLGQQFRVETAANGREALERATQTRPDLILADVMMPELDGFALLAALRADTRTSTVPVILLSARAGEEARIEGLSAGADDYLVKPFGARELLARVNAQIELSRLRREAVEGAESAAARLRILADVSAAIASTLDCDEMLRRLARSVVPAIADWCFVDALSAAGQIRRVACEAADPADEPLRRVLALVTPEAGRRDPLRDKLRAGRTELVATVDEAWLRAHVLDGAHVEAVRQMGMRSVVAVPLVSHGRHFGALSFVTARSGRSFTPADLPLLKEIGARASLGLGHAQLFERTQTLLAEAERARGEAERANRAKDEFLATLSHELRSPLQSILGWVTLLKEGQLDVQQAKRAVEAVDRSVRAQAQLINDLLEVSRIVSGKLVIERQPVSLALAVETAVEQLVPQALEKGVRLEYEAAECGPVIGDRARLVQVVSNLLTNAIRFTPAGGRVEVRCFGADGHAVVTVRDTGAGIAPDFLPQLFRPFTQADASSTRRHGGLGLGLAIVRHILELHGGTVWADSAGPGHGATFTVCLPFALRDAPQAAPVGSPLETSAGAERLDGARLLVVEDDPDSRDALAWALRSRGAHVRSAASVGEALAACREQPPEVILSDLAMPDEDGYALLERLRGLGLELPAIALTGFAGAEDRERALEAGFRDHVAKPIDSNKLVRVVRRVIAERGAA